MMEVKSARGWWVREGDAGVITFLPGPAQPPGPSSWYSFCRRLHSSPRKRYSGKPCFIKMKTAGQREVQWLPKARQMAAPGAWSLRSGTVPYGAAGPRRHLWRGARRGEG